MLTQSGQPGPVGGYPRQIGQFGGTDPPQRTVVVGVQGALGLCDEVGAQDQPRPDGDVVTESLPDDDVHPEFLA